MKRTIVASVALLLAGAGLTAAQRPSVIRTDAPPPAPVTPPTRIATNEPTPRPSVLRVNRKVEDPPAPLPAPKLAVDPSPTPSVIAAPELAPPMVEAPPVAPMPSPACAEPSYATSFVEPCFSWMGPKRRCGTVYLNTPYFWFSAEYLLARIKSQSTVPLVTTAPVTATPPRGSLDNGTVLFDGNGLVDHPFHGGRFEVGGWFDECQYFGGRLGFFFLGAMDHDFYFGANTNQNNTGIFDPPGLYIPFQNALSNTLPEDSFIVAENGLSSGAVRINSRSSLLGGDGHFLFSVARSCSMRIDSMVGFRYLQLDEAITVEEDIRTFQNNNFQIPIPALGGNFAPPVRIGVVDRIGARNDFYGADLGFRAHVERGCWWADFSARFAIGGTHQVSRNEGETTYSIVGVPTVVTEGGRLAVRGTNLGTFSRDTFTFVPELGLTLGYQPCHWLRCSVGYNWLYWPHVLRSGDQIERVINPTGVPTRPEFNPNAAVDPIRPAVLFRETDFWMQSVTFGVQLLF